MDFHEICDAFGGSIFPEEYRGDYTSIAQRIQNLEREATRGLDPEIQLRKVLFSATISIFQSDHQAADRWLDVGLQYVEANGLEQRWKLRFYAYRILNATFRTYPPILRTSPLQHGPSSCLDSTHDEFTSMLSECFTFISAEKNILSSVDIIEIETIFLIAACSRGYQRGLPRVTYDGGVGAPVVTRISLDQACKLLSINPTELERQAWNLGFVPVSRAISRLCIEYEFRGSRSFDLSALLKLRQVYESDGDRVGGAALLVSLADSLVSGHQTCPNMMNLLPMELHYWKPFTPLVTPAQYSQGFLHTAPAQLSTIINLTSATHSDWSELQTSFRILARQQAALPTLGNELLCARVCLDLAIPLYITAQTIFEGVNCLRGLAAVYLRAAALEHMLALNQASELAESGPALNASARIFYHAAIRHAEVVADISQMSIAEIYGQNDSLPGPESLREAAKRAYLSHGHIQVQYLALTLQQAGYWLQYARGRQVPASWYLELARRCFYHIPSLYACWYIATGAIIDCDASTGLISNARVHLTYLRSSHERLINVIGETLAVSPTVPHGIRAQRKADLEELRRIITHILFRLGLQVSTHSQVFPLTLQESLTRCLRLADTYCAGPNAAGYRKDIQDAQNLVSFRAMEYDLRKSREECATRCVYSGEDLSTVNSHGTILMLNKLYTLRVFDITAAQRLVDVLLSRLRCAALKLLREVNGQIPMSAGTTEHPWTILQYLSQAQQPSIKLRLAIIFEVMLRLSLTGSGDSLQNDSVISARAAMLMVWPQFFKPAGAYSSTWPWQRILWYALIHEQGNEPDALRIAFHGFGRVYKMIRTNVLESNTMLLEEDREMFLVADIGRAVCSLARMLIHYHDERFSLFEPETVHEEEDATKLIDLGKKMYTRQLSPQVAALGAIATLETIKSPYILRTLRTHETKAAAQSDVESHSQYIAAYVKYVRWQALSGLDRLRTKEEEEELQQIGTLRDSGIEKLLITQRAWSPNNLQSIVPQGLSWVPSNTAVLYTASSEDGLGLFCIIDQNLVHASWNSAISRSMISHNVQKYLQILVKDKHHADIAMLDGISRMLSDAILTPVWRWLRMKMTVLFITAGDLGRFPLSALLTPDTCGRNYLGASKAVMSIPSLALWKHYAETPHVHQEQNPSWRIVAKPGKMSDRLYGGEPFLPLGGMEAVTLARLWQTTVQDGATVTRDQFRKELAEAHCLHISTHAYDDKQSPSRAYMSMKDKVRILDLVQTSSTADLVIMSSCFTGEGTTLGSDDMIGFSHAILATGARTFMGCRWAVNELSTLVFMVVFHSRMKLMVSMGHRMPYAALLQSTVYFFLRSGAATAKSTLQHVLQVWDELEEDTSVTVKPSHFVKGGRVRLMNEIALQNDPENQLDLSHPFFWAPFVMIGDPSLRVPMKPESQCTQAELELRQASTVNDVARLLKGAVPAEMIADYITDICTFSLLSDVYKSEFGRSADAATAELTERRYRPC